MATARVVDVDEEPILRHFCLEAECTQVLKWFGEQGRSRPEEFEDRLVLAAALREQGNKLFQAADFEGAMLHTLGALHCADFSQARGCLQTDAQKRELHEHLVRIISNLSIVFLKKSDAYNAARAADLGLEYARRLPAASVEQIRAKLLFRRGLARGQTRDFVDARADLREAARLMPDNREVRHALENCKAFEREDRGAPDDKWRGLLTDSPQKVQQSKRRERCWRRVRTGPHKVFASMRNPENLRAGAKALALVLLGPVISVVTRMVMARVVMGRR